jgi:hypothetical protein
MTKTATKTVLTAEAGRKFIAIGPFCWGTGKTDAEAVKNARRNFSTMYAKKFCYILYEGQDDITIDGMGNLCYVPREEPGKKPWSVVRKVGVK